MDYDVLIVGAGLAGLSAAYAAARVGKSVFIACKERIRSSSFYAQGGIAVALGEEGDSWQKHLGDTINAGAGLVDEKAARVLTRKGVARVKELIELGAEFDKEGSELSIGREAAHSEKRILHMGGDATGRNLSKFLGSLVKEEKSVFLKEMFLLKELLVEESECFGAVFLNEETGTEEAIHGNAVVIASGGYAGLYSNSSNPPSSIASALIPCFEAGTELTDLEFVQFHPTVLYSDGGFLVSEAVRGEGALLVNSKGKRFVNELTGRDVVSRAVFLQEMKGEKVFLDARMLEKSFFEKRFPTICKKLEEIGLNPAKELIPVSPAAHYCMGGIKTDENARTRVKRLYACGEASCTGVHGANRLASNSLLEAIVFGFRAGENAVKEKKGSKIMTGKKTRESRGKNKRILEDKGAFNALRKTMWENVGIIREENGLRKALHEIKALEKQVHYENDFVSIELNNALQLAELTARAALTREESRGAHYRSDFPTTREEWRKHVVFNWKNTK